MEEGVEQERLSKRETSALFLRKEKEAKIAQDAARVSAQQLEEVTSMLQMATLERERADASLQNLRRALLV